MSRYTYEGKFTNPCKGFFVKEVGDHFEIWVRDDRHEDGHCEADRKHTMRDNSFEDYGDAVECIDQMHESFEEDYDSYLEENHDAIVQMERYEAFRNEY